jgi:ABC-2 type transport system ATP-binding protein
MLNLSDNIQSLEQAEPVIRLENISVRYRAPEERIGTFKEYAIRLLRRQIEFKEFTALNNVSLDVRKGEILGIIGRNGAGKSTLLKVISRVLIPKSGRVWIKGRIAPLLELGAGFHPELTGRENIFVNGTLLGHTHLEIEERLDSILEFAELAEFIDAPLRTYSSGMMARLGFAVATAWIPDILIIDEVLGVGDYAFQQKCQARMEDFRNSGTTILLVTHDTNTVQKLCDRVAWLERGVLQQLGPANDVVDIYIAESTFKNWYTFLSQSPQRNIQHLDGDGVCDLGVFSDKDMHQSNSITSENRMILRFLNEFNGLVKFVLEKDAPFFVSQRIIRRKGFCDLAGITSDEFAKEQWFTQYDFQSMQTSLLVANPNRNLAAQIEVHLGKVKQDVCDILPNSTVLLQYPGLAIGPIRIISKNNVLIFSRKQVYKDDHFHFLMGLSAAKFSTENWFTWYDSRIMDACITVANPDEICSTKIEIYVGGQKQGDYEIAPRDYIDIRYHNLVSGPIKIVSTNQSPIFSSIRALCGSSYSEVLGQSLSDAAMVHWFPWYDAQSMQSWIMIVNPDAQQIAEVDVYLNEEKLGSFDILPGSCVAPYFAELVGGPLRVVSSNNLPVLVSQRILYFGSFIELLSLKSSQIANEYWFFCTNEPIFQSWLVLDELRK